MGQAVKDKRLAGYLGETKNVIHERILGVKRERNSGDQDQI